MKLSLKSLKTAVLLTSLLALTAPALADEVDAPPPDLPSGNLPPPVRKENSPAALQSDPDAPFRAFQLYADRERTRRIFSAAGGAVFGASTMGVGAFIANKTDTSKTPWLVGGGILTGLSLLAIIAPSEAEQVASKVSSSSSGHTAQESAELLATWKTLAASLRTERLVGSSIGLLLGAGSLATGIALAAGAGDLSDNQQAGWGGFLMGSGVAMISGSVLSLCLKSDAEASYEQFMTSQSKRDANVLSSLKLDVAAAPSGFFLGAHGIF